MPGSHHPCGPVEHRTEVVGPPQLGFAGRDAHPNRQLQRPLRGHRGTPRGARRGERGAHAVAGVLEQPAAVRLDRPAQHLVVGGEGDPHLVRVGLPPTGRTLNIGEQKRHHPRRSSRRRSGNPSRISQQTRSHLTHRRNPTETPMPRGAAPHLDPRLTPVLNQSGAAFVLPPEGLVMDIPETGVMRVLYNQHGAALWRYACRLTGDATRAEEVVQQTLLRAGQHPQMVDGNERSARAWLFTVSRDMISSNGSGTPEAGGSDELYPAP